MTILEISQNLWMAWKQMNLHIGGLENSNNVNKNLSAVLFSFHLVGKQSGAIHPIFLY